MFLNVTSYNLQVATSKMIKKLLTALYADDNIFCFNEEFCNAVFSCNKMGILSIDLIDINLDDTNCDEVDPETNIHIRILAWHIEALKKVLMLIA